MCLYQFFFIPIVGNKVGILQVLVKRASNFPFTTFMGCCIYYPQRAQRAGGIVRDWQIFGYGSDFPTWSEVGTKSKAKVPNFGGNFEPSYLWTGKSF